jgi:phage repressor protein C with HTH and peptisase S24 domain
MLATGKPDLIRDLARAKGLPRADRLDRLAEVLGTSSQWLLNGGEEGAPARPRLRTTATPETNDRRMEYRSAEADLGLLPHVGAASAGEHEGIDDDVEMIELDLGEVLEYVSRDPGLRDPHAYVVTCVGDSMVPRFRPRERLTISPQAPVSIGDDVVVQLKGQVGEDERIKLALVKELVRRTGTAIVLRQHNPPREFEVPKARVHSIHKVMSARY